MNFGGQNDNIEIIKRIKMNKSRKCYSLDEVFFTYRRNVSLKSLKQHVINDI